MRELANLHEDVGEILLTEEEIAAKVRDLGARISADYAGRRITLVSVLKGSLPFMADLMRAIDIPGTVDPPVAAPSRRRRRAATADPATKGPAILS